MPNSKRAAASEGTLVAVYRLTIDVRRSLRDVGSEMVLKVEPHRRTTYHDGIKALREHPVQDELVELVNPLIQTLESIRHLWALG